MPASAQLYQRLGQYEWTTTYWFQDTATASDAALNAITSAHAGLQHTAVLYDRWEVFNIDGSPNRTFIPTPATGGVGGEHVHPKYALYIRLNSPPNAGRASGKYIHAYGEGIVTNGALSAAGSTAMATYSATLADQNVRSSDNEDVVSATYKHPTRRRRLRRQP